MATRCGFASALLLLCMVSILLSQEPVTEDSHRDGPAGSHDQDYHYLEDGNFTDELVPRTGHHAWLHDVDPHVSFFVIKQKLQPTFQHDLKPTIVEKEPIHHKIPVSHDVVVEETVIHQDVLEKPTKDDSLSFIHLTKQMFEKLHNKTLEAKLYLLGQMKPLSDGSHKLVQLSKKSVENANEFVHSNVKPVFTSAPSIFVGGINHTYHGAKDLMGAKVKFVTVNGGHLMDRTKKAFEGAHTMFDDNIRKPISDGASKFADKTHKAMLDVRQWFFAVVSDNSTEDVEESLHELEEDLEEGIGVTRVVPIGGPETLEEALDLTNTASNGLDAESNVIEVEEEETLVEMAGPDGVREEYFDVIQPRNPQ